LFLCLDLVRKQLNSASNSSGSGRLCSGGKVR
jgi:hypothetical protein